MRNISSEIESFSMTRRASVDGVSVRSARGKVVPAVCVKVPPLYDRLPEDVRGRDEGGRIYEAVAAWWWREVPQQEAEVCFPGMPVKAVADGRSDGWLVVFGLGDPREWSGRMLAAWRRFEKRIKSSMKDAEGRYVKAVRASGRKS